MAWSGLVVLVVTFESFLYLGVVLPFCIFALLIVAGFGIDREYEDSSSSDLLIKVIYIM